MSLRKHNSSNGKLLSGNKEVTFKMVTGNVCAVRPSRFLRKPANKNVMLVANNICELSQIPNMIMSEDDDGGNKMDDTSELFESTVNAGEAVQYNDETQMELIAEKVEEGNEKLKELDQSIEKVEENKNLDNKQEQVNNEADIDTPLPSDNEINVTKNDCVVKENVTANTICEKSVPQPKVKETLSIVQSPRVNVQVLNRVTTTNLPAAFKICKVVRHSDGTTSSIETNIDEIPIADQASVVRTMLEKLPQVVKQKETLKPETRIVQKDNPTTNTKAVSILSIPSTSSQKIISTSNSNGFTIITPSVTSTNTVTPLTLKPLVHTYETNLPTRGKVMEKFRKIAPRPLLPDVNLVQQPVLHPKPLFESENHACKSERYYECNGCKMHFKNAPDYLTHGALNHLKAFPHLFATGCVIECKLCTNEDASLTDLQAAKEHLERHVTEMSTKCDVCSRVVARDHIYASKDNKDVLAERKIASNVIEKNMDEDVIVICENNVCADDDDDEDTNKLNDDVIEVKDSSSLTNTTSVVIYKCHYCDKQFKKKSMCQVHVKAHLGGQTISCQICGMIFHSKQSLAVHTQIHLKIQLKKEKHVEKKEKKKGTLVDATDLTQPTVETTSNITNENLTKSPVKRKKDPNAIKLVKSPSGNPNAPVLCETCGMEFPNSRRLALHQKKIHKICKSDPKVLEPTTCVDCGKVCRGPSALKVHQRNWCGIKEVLCELCGKMIPVGNRAFSNHRYQFHRKVGGVEIRKKKVKKKVEVNGDDVKKGNKVKKLVPKTCELCGFVSTHSTSLRVHLVNKHNYPKLRERNYKNEPINCDKCGLSCKGPSALKLHKSRFCLGGQTLVCQICSKTFNNRKKYSTHKYNHKAWKLGREQRMRRKKEILSEMEPKADDDLDGSKSDDQSLQIAVGSIESENNTDTKTEITTESETIMETDTVNVEKTDHDDITDMTLPTETNERQNVVENMYVDGDPSLLQVVGNNLELNGQAVHLLLGDSVNTECNLVEISELGLQTPVVQQPNQMVNYYQLIVTPNGESVLALMPPPPHPD